jgi:Domain of unknown function (DUF5658)
MAQAELALPRDGRVGPSRRPHQSQMHVTRLLLLLFVELQLADIVSTNTALALPGIWEANPLMALSQAQLGAAWWLPKAAAVVICCVAAPLVRRCWPLVFAVAYYAIIVSVNLAQL